MYAVVKTSGRQYRVSPGDTFSVEKLEGTPGATFDLNEVLMIGGDATLLGTPFVKGAKVTVVVEHQYRGPKILVFKKKRRHKYRNMRGHRSELTRLFVSEITTPSGVVKAETKAHVMDLDRTAKKLEHKEKHANKHAEMKAAGAEGDVTVKAKSPAKKKRAAVKNREKPAARKKQLENPKQKNNRG